jgi:acyl-CoA reductase-like NAD-dependent aldehyde dehydrogenase
MAPLATPSLTHQTKRPTPNLDFEGSFVHIIGGKPSPTKQTRHGVNPANLQPKADVPLAAEEDLDRAVSSAKEAFKTWSQVPYEERRSAVLAFADAIDQLRTQFRDLLVAEQGKPVSRFLLFKPWGYFFT